MICYKIINYFPEEAEYLKDVAKHPNYAVCFGVGDSGTFIYLICAYPVPDTETELLRFLKKVRAQEYEINLILDKV